MTNVLYLHYTVLRWCCGRSKVVNDYCRWRIATYLSWKTLIAIILSLGTTSPRFDCLLTLLTWYCRKSLFCASVLLVWRQAELQQSWKVLAVDPAQLGITLENYTGSTESESSSRVQYWTLNYSASCRQLQWFLEYHCSFYFLSWCNLLCLHPTYEYGQRHTVCPVRPCVLASVCASQNIVNTISCRVVDTFSPNLHQRCVMGQRWTFHNLGSKVQRSRWR